jgi:hypothetical protein
VLLALVLLAAPSGVATVPAVSVGEPPVDASVLKKISELTDDALRRAQVPEPSVRLDPGQALVEKARTAYYELKFKQAVADAEAAIAHYEQEPLDLGDGQRFIAAHTYAAMAELELGNEKAVQRHFAAALTVRPDLHLLETDFSPVSIAALERARDQNITGKPKGSVTVTTSPAFAKLRVDGVNVGETPLTFNNLLVGRHFVSVSKEGHAPQAAWVDVTANRTAQLTFTLAEAPAEQLRRGLAARIAAGAKNEVEGDARKLAAALDAQAVLLLAVSAPGSRLLVSAAWVPAEGDSTRAWTTVSADLFDAPAAIEALIAGLQAKGGEVTLPDAKAVKVAPPDYGVAWLGLKPPPPKILAAPPPAAPPPTPLYKRPWLWVAVGAVAVAGGATAIYFATRPPPAPPGVQIMIQLP